MNYNSTREKEGKLSAARAILSGLAPDGGLLTPEVLPKLSSNAVNSMLDMSYQQRAVYVMKIFLDDFSANELATFATRAYGPDKFDGGDAAPVRPVDETTYALELWHGPTCAFKDMALQMLPQLLSASLTKTGEAQTAYILVATSGDTGKAALEGFRDVDKTKILVFYPKDGVSDIQALQMLTQEGGNVGVCAVEGNFDDAQTGVKAIFADPSAKETLAARGCFLSSANSINWGRVLPQIVYYVSAYCDLVRDGKVENGEAVNVCVPTGNFGNILAAYYAKSMGIPLGKLICASNSNNVLTDFIQTGVYDRNRKFYTTISPSMDILISSNLERLLYDLSAQDAEAVSGYMAALNKTGRYEVSDTIKRKLGQIFAAGYCDENRTRAAIGKLWNERGYLIDPHTAVGFAVLEDYRAESGDTAPAIVVSTASPFKFCGSVLEALGVEDLAPGTEILSQLSDLTGLPVPAPLAGLAGKPVRFHDMCAKSDMARAVLDFE